MQHSLAHIGWITSDINKFEAFWCNILGFKCCYTGYVSGTMANSLFGTDPSLSPELRRYNHSDWNIEIEIHCFEKDEEVTRKPFQTIGINHICLHTGSCTTNSRTNFLKSLPAMVQVHIYHNPGGWDNILIRDFENNWIELRETFE